MSTNTNGTASWLSSFLANSSAADIVQYPIQLLLLIFHIGLTTFVVIRVVERNTKFSAAFYKLFLLQSFANYATYATVVLNQLEPFGLFLGENQMAMVIYNSIYQFATFLQLFSYSAIAFNRFTAIVFPVSHYTLWRGRTLRLLVVLTVLLTFPSTFIRPIITAICLWTRGYETFEDAWAFAGQIRASSNSAHIFAVTIIDAVLEIWTFAVYMKMDVAKKNTQHENYRLLVYTMLGMTIQLYKVVYYVGIYVHFPGIEAGFINVFTFYLFEYQCLVGPVFLFTTSKVVRHGFLAAIGLQSFSDENNVKLLSSSKTTAT